MELNPSTIRIFFLLLTTGLLSTSYAQTLYSRDAKITVQPNTTVSIRGSVENQGTFVNNGHLKVSGPWVNAGTYTSGEGHITFNGTSATVPQIIHHNGQAFSRVTITGGTKKILLSDVVVAKEIEFVHGIVESSGDARIVFGPDVLIGGASDSSHIHGAVYHKGSGHKLFPIGSGLIYFPVELTDVADPLAHIGIRGFHFENLNLSKPPSLEAISDRRYWYIDAGSGSIPATQVILPLRDESWVSNPENVVVVQAHSPTESFGSIGRSYFANSAVMGRVMSKLNVSMPFVSLATAAVDSELVVYNAVSANGDGLNDYLRIDNIENYPGNRFKVFNRWGDRIFEVENYDNHERAFKGRANINGDAELVSGTYFYVLEIPGVESLRGFIAVKN